MSATRQNLSIPASVGARRHLDDQIEADLTAVLATHDVGQLQNYWKASHGIENANYFVEVEQAGRTRTLVVTFMLQPPFAGPGYFPLLAALSDFGLPVANAMQNKDGAYVTELKDYIALVQPCLSGQHTVNPTSRQIQSLARFVAHMHTRSDSSALNLPQYPRDLAWLQRTASEVAPQLSYTDQVLLQDAVVKVGSLLSRGDAAAMPVGTIHADLFRDNVLFNERGLTGVLDFHHASTGFYLYDLCVIANDWCNDAEGMLDSDRTLALLQAYHRIRPLSQTEVWFFPVFTLYAALSFWLSRTVAQLANKRDPSTRFKDPEEFRRIVANHLRLSFYVDPRLLGI